MSTDGREYVIAPWGTGNPETTDLTIELPSREVVAQVEVPASALESAAELGDRHGITVERALAERLEINRARVSLLAARAADDVAEIQRHLTEAHEFLSGVEELDTAAVEDEIDRVWSSELDFV